MPPEWQGDRGGYLELVTGPMLTAVADRARWIDVFCEPGSPHAFDAEETRAVLLAGRAAGLGLRLHGNQLGPGPGVQLAVELEAASVDHCTYLSDADVDALADAAETTVATLLPGVEFCTRSPYPDAARLLRAGVRIALATDCNPGTCYSSSMPLVIALAVREMGLTPAQALYAATAGSARSLRRTDIGRVVVGARADFAVLDAPSYIHLAYRPGVPIAHALDLEWSCQVKGSAAPVPDRPMRIAGAAGLPPAGYDERRDRRMTSVKVGVHLPVAGRGCLTGDHRAGHGGGRADRAAVGAAGVDPRLTLPVMLQVNGNVTAEPPDERGPLVGSPEQVAADLDRPRRWASITSTGTPTPTRSASFRCWRNCAAADRQLRHSGSSPGSSSAISARGVLASSTLVS